MIEKRIRARRQRQGMGSFWSSVRDGARWKITPAKMKEENAKHPLVMLGLGGISADPCKGYGEDSFAVKMARTLTNAHVISGHPCMNRTAKPGDQIVGAPLGTVVPSPTSSGNYIAIGDATAPPTTTISDAIGSDTAKTVSAIALTYHGYRRTGSLIWALAYGLAGHLVPVVAVPVAVAQGFGKRRVCTTE